MPLLSIVTITYNAEATLERTIESVRRQDYKNIEYIIVDGASTDGTLRIAYRHQETVNRVVSERDQGIYDAMNKGLALATGDYVWFVNAGDELRDPSTARLAMECATASAATSKEWADVIYGDTVITDMAGQEIGGRRLTPPESLTAESFRRGMLVCHQAFIARRTMSPRYDLRYRLSADFEWCLSILERASRVTNSHLTLARFLDGGITKSNIPTALRERFCIMCRHFGVASTVWNHIPIAFKFFRFLIANRRF